MTISVFILPFCRLWTGRRNVQGIWPNQRAGYTGKARETSVLPPYCSHHCKDLGEVREREWDDVSWNKICRERIIFWYIIFCVPALCHVFISPNWIMDDSRNSIQSGSADSASAKLLYKGSALPSVGYHRHKTYQNQSVYCIISYN